MTRRGALMHGVEIDTEAKQYIDMPTWKELEAAGLGAAALAWWEECGLNIKQIPEPVTLVISHEGRLKFRGYALNPAGALYGHSCCNPRDFHVVMTEVVAPQIVPVPPALQRLVMRYGTRESAYPEAVSA